MADPRETQQPADTTIPIGRVVSVSGSQAVVMLEGGTSEQRDNANRAEMGTILKIETPRSALLGLISALSVPVPAQTDGQGEIRVAELEMVGELMKTPNGLERFRRGVSAYPYLGDPVYLTSGEELRKAYMWNSEQAVRVGSLRQDPSIAALVQVDDLLGKHCAILGSTGTGKSCSVALILRAILEKNRNAHILLLDMHNEYATCFGDMAEVITPNDLQLPFWFLNFEELVEVIIGDVAGHEAEVEILSEVIPLAKQRFAANRGRDSQIALKKGLGPNEVLSYTVDTPVPYRISDLIGLIDQRLGRLENRRDLMPYRQLKTRLEAVSQDARYSFMFGALTVHDHMARTLAR
ncbi:MAG: ATP-binding protein, partial [Hyphomicrobiales bacterium]